jgi:hypothetical protein
MRHFRPSPSARDDNDSDLVEVFDFGPNAAGVSALAGSAWLDMSIGLIRDDGTRATHRGTNYELTPTYCCIAVRADGRRFVASREGITQHLRRLGQPGLIELEEA